MRCEEFYEKWKRHPNFCEKNRLSVRLIDFYLKIVDELKARGIDSDVTYVTLSENACRPLHTVKDEVVRNVVLTNIAGMIKRGGRPSAADIKVWIEAATPQDEPQIKPAEIETEEEPVVSAPYVATPINKVTTIPHTDTCLRCKRMKEEECETCDPIHIGFSIQYCRNKKCPHLKKREMNDNFECEITGKLPGNMAECPLILEAIEKKTTETETEEDKKYPVTAKCKALNCKDLESVRPGLHICKIKGMRPENMNGRLPDTCPQNGVGLFGKYVTIEKPAEVKKEEENAVPVTYVTPEPEAPEYEPPNEYLARQIDRCRHRRCPELVDDEYQTICKVMEVHREKGTPWCRYDCPLRPVVQDPKLYDGSRVSGPSFKSSIESAPAVIHRPVTTTQGQSDVRDFTITARRYAQGVIRQVIRHGMAETEDEAAQKIFDLGVEKMLDEVDRQVQRQADEDAAAFDEVDA